MKKLLLVLITSLALISCGRENKSVRFPNGAIVQAQNTTEIDYSVHSKVCVRKSSISGWQICNDGEMQDTVYVIKYKRDGIEHANLVTHKVGVVSSHL